MRVLLVVTFSALLAGCASPAPKKKVLLKELPTWTCQKGHESFMVVELHSGDASRDGQYCAVCYALFLQDLMEHDRAWKKGEAVVEAPSKKDRKGSGLQKKNGGATMAEPVD